MKPVARAIEALNTAGFALIIGSVIYFILGNVVSLVHGTMLDWTFCGTAHRLFGVEWCGLEADTGLSEFDHFTHKLVNTTLPWFMIFWGFVLTGLCAVLAKLVDQPNPFKRKTAQDETLPHDRA